MPLSSSSIVRLSNGVAVPVIGAGTFQVPGDEAYRMVRDALDIGYRHVDTAAYYQNEEAVGRAIRDSGVPRDEVFVTTKLWNDAHGYEEALAAFDRSLGLLGLGYVDLYLIHWPRGGKREETWRALEKVCIEGRARAIGVSNYTVRHLEEMASYCDIPPMVDQVELSPYLYQRELLEHCRQHRVQVEAFSPLTRGRKLGDPRLAALAGRYGKSPAQVMVRWSLQHGLVALPKSVHRERLRENLEVFDFELSAADMALMDSFNENLRTTHDPEEIP